MAALSWPLTLFLLLVLINLLRIEFCDCMVSSSSSSDRFVILGGTGRIGTAVASHLLLRAPRSQIVLVGRNRDKGCAAVEEVLSERPGASVLWKRLDDVWSSRYSDELASILTDADCLVHTAGPYLGERPIPLQVAIRAGVRVYVDVSDPLDYLQESLDMTHEAARSKTSALVSAGAFPGMSNVLAVEATSRLNDEVQDVRFNYFTAGLGGSGDVNLYITNLGFGEPMIQYDHGALRPFQALSGLLLGKVNFYLEKEAGYGNEVAKNRVGSQTVFSWPFPEAATVPKEIGIVGDSSAAMGTAPGVWNDMLGLLVSIVPRQLWKSRRFSQFLADFSQPLVKLTDNILRLLSPDGVGETHAMRVDVTGVKGGSVSAVQGHESFRRCVGQSCAEFALDMLEHSAAGVNLPEQRYHEDKARSRIIERLTTTPGTFCYTGPVELSEGAPAPTNMDDAIRKANDSERRWKKQ